MATSSDAAAGPDVADPPTRRVVITGIGVVSAMGLGIDTFLEGLRAGRNCARPISAFDTTGFAHANGCEVPASRPSLARRDPARSAGPPVRRRRRPGWPSTRRVDCGRSS